MENAVYSLFPLYLTVKLRFAKILPRGKMQTRSVFFMQNYSLEGKKNMRSLSRWIFVSGLLCFAAGCQETPDNEPAANAPQPPLPPPPPPAPAVGAQGAADDDSVPVEVVDPRVFAKEQAAADELEKLGVFVVREPPDKQVTSANFMGNRKRSTRKCSTCCRL